MMADSPRIGSVRIVRADSLNVAVQVFSEIINPKTKEKRLGWQDRGYYGHRLDHAAESALFQAMPEGQPITAADVRSAIAEIVASTHKALEVR